METIVGASLIFGVSGFLAWRIGRFRGHWWLAGYAVSMFIVIVLNITRYVPSTLNTAPGQWLLMGQRDLFLIGIAAMLGIIPCMHKVRARRTRVLLILFMAVLMMRSSVLPLMGPVLDRARLERLPTFIDEDEVCLQTTDFTCGPAALVSALLVFGIEETESNAAIETLSNSFNGTRSIDIATYVNRAYGHLGLRATYRYVRSLDELRDFGGVAIAEVKANFWMDHFVTIVGWNGTAPIVADPFYGQFEPTSEAFAKTWRHKAIVIVIRQEERTARGDLDQRVAVGGSDI